MRRTACVDVVILNYESRITILYQSFKIKETARDLAKVVTFCIFFRLYLFVSTL